MASHQLAIAKASFSAGLLRPDPTSVPRDAITAFHTSLDRALSQCTPANIQTCKTWLLDHHVVSSSNRVGVWAKYLVALSGSFDDAAPSQTSAKRKRLHILYLLNDLFHHTKYHLPTTAAFATLTGALQPHVVDLLGAAAGYPRDQHPKHHRRLDELLDIWATHGYYAADYVRKLREVVQNAALSGPVKTSLIVEESLAVAEKELSSLQQHQKNLPFVMPATHGDPATPWYDLPAGNLIPHIIPDEPVPLRGETVKPLQFLAGPADGKLVAALKRFLGEVDGLYAGAADEALELEEDEVVDLDELGQLVVRESLSGEIIKGETYYGWSRGFCQQMKKRAQKGKEERSRSRSRSRGRSSRSRSRSRSRDAYHKRRYSDSESEAGGRWRDDSRSPRRRRYDARSRSRTRSRSRSPPPRAGAWQQPGQRSRSYSPQPAPAGYHPDYRQPPAPAANPYGHAPPPPSLLPPTPHALPPAPPHPSMGYPPPPPPSSYQTGFPPGPPGPPGLPHAPPPPPPPPNYQGPWPPPPPPMPFAPPHQPSHFPPPYQQGPPGQPPAQYHHPPAQYQAQSGPYAQQMPPGSYHFPPPHASHGHGHGHGRGWQQYPRGGR
ncbi:hypothetical protein BO86DRAFT_446047 [Aspergillus japonicus CBS 114.51]|uniref:CID domain-containing protein n=1 Tax=Aspergillus japonicus CBS 114.51 TaxID=1448312 RepID=A0A8T8X9Z9_ASPJA|nr:hypothetical protein BO86DRAFT_446047 [Aspergillus japonicus CBS 114.51]RAH85043.1 hypothetical protein BO86DRAFT_446047 [Aspergillus japonicus CBS 114.51]